MYCSCVRRGSHYFPNQSITSPGSPHSRLRYSWLPHRLLLVRHGESEANVRREVYSTTPDWRIPLTQRGREQAYDCGRRLRRIIQDEQIYVYYSPYQRTRQTLEEIRKSFPDSQIQGEREDERLREQEMGNYQPLEDMDATWEQRNAFGRLYYRFPFGESGADVGDRVSSFFDSLLRERIGLTIPNLNEEYGPERLAEWEQEMRIHLSTSERGDTGRLHPSPSPSPPSSEFAPPPWQDNPPVDPASYSKQNVVIVAHGLLIRLFIARWFRVPMEVFETMVNPPNCAIVRLERDDKQQRLVMSDISKSLFGSDPLLQMMDFQGEGNTTAWYRERFLGIVSARKGSQGSTPVGRTPRASAHYDTSFTAPGGGATTGTATTPISSSSSGVVPPGKEAVYDEVDLQLVEHIPEEDDDENHYYRSHQHNRDIGAPKPYRPILRKNSTDSSHNNNNNSNSNTDNNNNNNNNAWKHTSNLDGDLDEDIHQKIEKKRLEKWLHHGFW